MPKIALKWPRIRRDIVFFLIKRVLRLLLLIYVAVGCYGYFFSERQIFQPQPASYQDNPAILKLTTADGARISAMYLPNPQAAYTLLYSHGNAEDLGDVRPILEALQGLGLNVFAYDYRGYGTSEGHPSEQHAYQDIDAAYRYLRETLNLPADRILAYGRSVGSGPTVDLASRQPLAGLVLESAFTSTFRVITRITLYPFDRFANLSKIGAVHCPVLLLHGTSDRTIPFHHSQTLFQRANSPKQFLAVPGADHNEVFWVAGDRYAQTLREFVQTVEQFRTNEKARLAPG